MMNESDLRAYIQQSLVAPDEENDAFNVFRNRLQEASTSSGEIVGPYQELAGKLVDIPAELFLLASCYAQALYSAEEIKKELKHMPVQDKEVFSLLGLPVEAEEQLNTAPPLLNTTEEISQQPIKHRGINPSRQRETKSKKHAPSERRRERTINIYQPEGVMHHTIALNSEEAAFLDSLMSLEEQRLDAAIKENLNETRKHSSQLMKQINTKFEAEGLTKPIGALDNQSNLKYYLIGNNLTFKNPAKRTREKTISSGENRDESFLAGDL